MAAARLAAPLPSTDTQQMLTAVRSAGKKSTSELDQLTMMALQQIPNGPGGYP